MINWKHRKDRKRKENKGAKWTIQFPGEPRSSISEWLTPSAYALRNSYEWPTDLWWEGHKMSANTVFFERLSMAIHAREEPYPWDMLQRALLHKSLGKTVLKQMKQELEVAADINFMLAHWR